MAYLTREEVTRLVESIASEVAKEEGMSDSDEKIVAHLLMAWLGMHESTLECAICDEYLEVR